MASLGTRARTGTLVAQDGVRTWREGLPHRELVVRRTVHSLKDQLSGIGADLQEEERPFRVAAPP